MTTKSREFKLLTLEHLWNGLSPKDTVLQLLTFSERMSLTARLKIAISPSKTDLTVFTVLFSQYFSSCLASQTKLFINHSIIAPLGMKSPAAVQRCRCAQSVLCRQVEPCSAHTLGQHEAALLMGRGGWAHCWVWSVSPPWAELLWATEMGKQSLVCTKDGTTSPHLLGGNK